MADNNNIVSCVALASNDYIVNGYTNGYIKIFDVKTKELICNWNSYHSSVVAISGLDNDGTFIVSAGDNDIKIWNKNDPIYTLNHNNVISVIGIEYGKHFMSTCKDGSNKMWNFINKRLVSENGEYIFYLLENKTVFVLNKSTNILISLGVNNVDDIELFEKSICINIIYTYSDGTQENQLINY